MTLLHVVRDVGSLLPADSRLVRLDPSVPIVFVGDVHGDALAVERVFERFSPPGMVVVFLGDIVDRGPSSREALEQVLTAKLEHPAAVVLLMGNHEAWGAVRFSPADFWESLSPKEASLVAGVLLRLPLAAWHASGVLALHGALPDLPTLDSLTRLAVSSAPWRDVTWGDWSELHAGLQTGTGRPVYGAKEFTERAEKLSVRVLVRSHQPDAPAYLFGDRCLTLFTSSVYGGGPRRVALLPPGRVVRSARDLDLIEI